MIRWMRRVSLCTSVLLLTLLLSFAAFAQTETGWVSKGGNWYYYTKAGTLAKNQWLKIGSSLFWMNEEGVMARETWIESEKNWYYLSASGAAASGWQEIDGKWYYFNKETLTMETNTTIDSWYVGADGAWDPSR